MDDDELCGVVREWLKHQPEAVREYLKESFMAFLLLHESSIPLQRPTVLQYRRAA